ncbi:E2F-associated phosphoprotein-like isoform X1 [Gigantopelta aegis]|uniref:E2F-associated phosphoprotein-like isoform X1 n=1 Tax=Gigantopelta aegis TaxID=1735272 RepID=UPI001B88C2F4|nr:E2F-associated phosphoprotein-like isoform X1 [Gigantopelta aegis]XP_041354523.1 E2F-associated phosphoprotein-like isoform X1 [Gigantopelta aegis]
MTLRFFFMVHLSSVADSVDYQRVAMIPLVKTTLRKKWTQSCKARLMHWKPSEKVAKEKKDVKTENQGASTSSTTTSSTAQFYDSIYFDSDEEEESSSGKTGSKRKHPVISNDDLLYDPNMDGDDQKWVDRQRVWCRPQTNTSRRNEKVKPLPSSDAVLDCPACMTTLCMDCQRHSTYSNQYRAMFVMNCVVDTSEILKYPKEIGKKKNKKKKRQSNRETTPDQTDDDKYNPVKCTECGTVVAMFDQDEVYHFFNILASHS